MAKLVQFSIVFILQLYSLSLKIFPLHANHLCSHDQSLSLLNFREGMQTVTNYRALCTNEFGLYGTVIVDYYCESNFSSIPGSQISSWNSSTDCCSWEGVTCDEFTGNVVELDLSFNRLNGKINSSSSIFQLSHLKRLNLAYNLLTLNISQFRRFTYLSHLNLTHSGFQGQIPSEISQLNELVSLDLSNTYGSFLEPHVFKVVLQNMSKLRELYLEGVNITSSLPNNLSTSLTILHLASTNLKGAFPYHIFHLPNLQQISLGDNFFDGLGSLSNFKWNTSSSLWKLELPTISISKKILDTIGNLKHLAFLDLSFCSLNGTLPQSFGNLTQLRHLDLSYNYFSGQIAQEIFGLEYLTLLDMEGNNLDAPIPHSSSNNLRSLKVLSLPSNKLTLTCVSSFLSNLTRLETIDLSFNPLYEMPLELFKLSCLQKISLEFTHLHGPIPQLFSNLDNLKYLNLASNQLSGRIKINTFSNNLMYLNLASNSFTGPIMYAFSNLANLKYLNLASNNFSGPIEVDTFSNLVNLITLDLSSNNFGCDLDVRFLSNIKWMDGLNLSFSSLSLTHESNTTLHMITINSLLLESCNISNLDVLRSIVVVEDLHLSNNNIHGEIPEWVWINWSNITTLDLSNNFITHIGKIPLQSLESLKFESNLLQGELPDLPQNIWTLSLSNNQLHGEIKSSLCKQREFLILDLSNNSLTGVLPHCISKAAYLDLHMNNLQGTIPDTFSMRFVRSLNLRDNHFEGKIPRSLINASYLMFLDLSENNLSDAFHVWLGDLPLRYLCLRSNKLYGSISSLNASESAFSDLQILDISCNQLNGHFPARVLKLFKRMMNASDTSSYSVVRLTGLSLHEYYNTMTMVLNGITIQLDRISYAMKIIDISCNHFEGEIPSSIGGLIGIQQLNLSHNSFTGQIPPQLGNLSNLQSLGLSHNQLDGNIPLQLADLGFLSVLNLSYNHLTGPIPTGRQLQTFSNNSYIGNDGLCGLPLSRKCGNDNAGTHVDVPDEEDHHEFFDGFTWQSVMVGYGTGICIGFVIGNIILFNEKPKWLIQIVMEEARRMCYKYKTRNGISWNITS